MKRRMYLLFPDVRHTARAVEELRQAGIVPENMRAIAREDIDIHPKCTQNGDRFIYRGFRSTTAQSARLTL